MDTNEKETEIPVNYVSLKRYVDMRFALLEKRVDDEGRTRNMQHHDHLNALAERFNERMEAQYIRFDERSKQSGVAIDKAEISVDKRLEAMNQFREQLNAQAVLFVTQEKLNGVMDVVLNKMDGIERDLDTRREGLRKEVTVKVDSLESEHATKIEALQVKVVSIVAVIAALQVALPFLWPLFMPGTP